MRQGRLSKAMQAKYNNTRSSVARKRVYTYKWMRFWAERGLIHIVDEREGQDGDYKVISTRDFACRASSFQKELNCGKYADERAEALNMLFDMKACWQTAKKQGDPFTDRGFREGARANRHIWGAVPEHIGGFVSDKIYTGS